MTINDVLIEIYQDILEERWNNNGHKNNERERYWDKSYISKNGRKGIWRYTHRDAIGAEPGDGTIVHHKDRNISNNNISNLEKTTRSEHLKLDPLNRKYSEDSKCKHKGCKKKPYSKDLCVAHYLQEYRKNKSV